MMQDRFCEKFTLQYVFLVTRTASLYMILTSIAYRYDCLEIRRTSVNIVLAQNMAGSSFYRSIHDTELYV